ncbi:glycosyltransferase family 4 protein [Burkholderia cenocepacia]|uniref:glycosyltransferase family 4 protein n=1 Tax=Burkholderia cenocepacia TaxID=95486 RepID=UPI001CF23412|nr:glycosyltransferase family 1 protein [Burkholderia cenocepacia]MCA7923255.1 glycosyltransferase family 4 protein [Burkholderia cenocepacia]
MNVVLAVDAIRPPLTGIGRYAWELATHYHRSPELESVRFLYGDRWVANPTNLVAGTAGEPRRRGLFRPLTKAWQTWSIKQRTSRSLFHSPNYFLPSFIEQGVVTVHDLSVFKYPETHPAARIRQFESQFSSTLARAHHLISDSWATRNEIVEYFGWPEQSISTVELGVAPEFHPRTTEELLIALQPLNLGPGTYTLCVSTLEPRKRIDRLLNAYRDIPADLRTRYPLVLAGSDGWLNESLKAAIATGEQEGWLRYLGFVPEAILPVLYAGARAFVFPSIYEGYGLPLLEALASGIPSLCSNRSSLPEVADGAAHLVEPDHHEALRDGIEHILTDDTWRTNARTRGLEISSRRSWSQCAKHTIDVYRRVASC